MIGNSIKKVIDQYYVKIFTYFIFLSNIIKRIISDIKIIYDRMPTNTDLVMQIVVDFIV